MNNELSMSSRVGTREDNTSLNDLLPDFSPRINDIKHRIDSVMSVSEKDFLEIGGKLQQYLSSSRELSQLSSQAASYISEDILQKGIDELSWLLKQFSELLTDSAAEIRNDEKELLNILSKISLVSNEFVGFGKIVKQLRMLGISTKIESSRLGSEDAGFYQLAEYVDRLSGFIGDKVKAISSKSDYLIKEINQATLNLSKLEKEQQEQSNIILQNTSLSLETFQNKYQQCSNKAQSISESSDQVSKNINDIVMSIQFHDITRQQMEHAKTALAELVLQNADHNSNDLGTIYDVCELQAYQLDHSSKEFTSAVKKIITNLDCVENNVDSIMSETCDLLSEKDSSNGLSLERVKDELTKISSGLKKNAQITNDLAQSIKSVLGIIEDLANSVSEIEDIGGEIELIALNARIKAAHIGSNGASLGILSEAIQTLSLGTKNQTELISSLLKTTGEISAKLKTNLDRVNNAGNNDKLEITNTKIHSLMNSMMELEKKAAGLITKLKEDVNSLQREISMTVNGITIHSIVEESINGVIAEINEVTSILKPYVDPDDKREKNIKDLAGKYTMHQERKIHQKYIEGKISSANESSYQVEDDQNAFGDNVELF